MPASGCSLGKSFGSMPTRSAEFAFSPSRASELIPFTITHSFSLAAATTVPPGHIQNVYAPLS